jgi:predicted anti-sigma-YlaC factor YlaD
MSERHLCELLPDYADGALHVRVAEQVEAHVRRCSDCADWLETYQGLAGLLGCSQQVSGALLAEYAVAPQRMTVVDREAVTAHLECCPSCRAEAELVHSALDAARDEPPRHRFPALHASRPLLMAATVLLATTVGLFAYFARSSSGESEQLVWDQTIQSSRTLEGEGTILIVDTKVQHGATLTVRAGRRVAFGSGFSISSDASMAVATDRRKR